MTDYKALADEIESWNKKVFCSFIPGNLDYLKAGGRVSNAAYLGATLLRLKPLIEIVDGKLLASKKYRGRLKNLWIHIWKNIWQNMMFPENVCI